MDRSRSDALPLAVRSIAAAAREALVCAPVPLPPGLAESLRAVVPPGVRIEFQLPPAAGLDVIVALLEAGHQVFEGAVPPEAQIFFDRRHGFRVPEWSALPDAFGAAGASSSPARAEARHDGAFGAAAKLIWSRRAAFVCVRGTPASVEANPVNDFVIVRLAENPTLRLSAPKSLGVLTVGRPVTLLGRHDFQFGMDTPLLECVAICDDEKGISHV